jgi:hypothetical protein
VHQKTLNRLVKFIDEFKTLNFVGDRDLEEQLERMRQEFLGRSAEEYRDSDYYRRKLREGLRNLADTAHDMAQSGSNGLVEQFGQMGRRRIHMADVSVSVDHEDRSADAEDDHAEEAAVAEEPSLAVAIA